MFVQNQSLTYDRMQPDINIQQQKIVVINSLSERFAKVVKYLFVCRHGQDHFANGTASSALIGPR